MFRPQPMVRIDILLLQQNLDHTVRALAGARILHLRRMQIQAGTEGGEKEERVRRLEELRALLRDQLAQLRMEPGLGALLDLDELPLWEKEAEQLQDRLRQLRKRSDELVRRRRDLLLLSRILHPLVAVVAGIEELSSLRFAGLRFGLLPEGALATFSPPAGVEFYFLGPCQGQGLVALLYLRRHGARMEQELGRVSFSPLVLPKGLAGPIPAALVRLNACRQRIRRRRNRLRAKLAALRRGWQNRLNDRLHAVETEARLLRARDAFGFTERTVLIGGYVPRNRLREVREILRQTCGEQFQVHSATAREEATPVLLRNPVLLRPFQRILAIQGTPSYGEIEPTPLLALAFLVLFGMMFGDLGHGLLLVAGGAAVRRCTRYREEGLLVIEVGIFSALFGLLFGSVFGLERLFPPLWFAPMQDIPRLMTASLALGAGLILTGLALRVVNGVRTEKPAMLLTDRYGAAGFLFYGGALASGYLVYRDALPITALAWLGIPLLAVFFRPLAEKRYRGFNPLLLAEGLVEVLETVLGYVANTFSFLRVAAFGLAHVGLAMAVFAVADQVRGLPLGGIWTLLVHLFGNLVIVLLEGLVVSVQSVRLEFYEVFSKFFRGGGTAYDPLALEAGAERRP